jgi:16S rRNA (guanine527-N7)-methyltransferase
LNHIHNEIKSQLEKLNVSRESLEYLQIYSETLLKWQKNINLIGPATEIDIWGRHIIDSLQLLSIINKKDDRQVIVDLGSGAGFPGLAISITRPHWQIHLVESNQKKVAFMREICRLTNINCIIHARRIEDFVANAPSQIDYITSRALAPLPKLLDLSAPILMGTQALFHKGQDVDAELSAATKYWKFRFIKHISVVNSASCILQLSHLDRQIVHES